MRNDLIKIISTLIKGVPTGDAGAKEICYGLDVIKNKWPGLTDIEKEELNVLIEALKTIEEEQDSKRLF